MSDERQNSGEPSSSDEPQGSADRQRGDLPPLLAERLDDLERQLFAPETGRALRQLGRSPELVRSAIRGLRAYLEGRDEEAVQSFEVLAEELRDETLSL